MSKTGRFYVRKGDRVFCVEPIDRHEGKKSLWGDLDPVTKKHSGDYGNKHSGSVLPENSIITEENGFINIVELPEGTSPSVG
jgi:hypothetical protein